MSAMQPKLVLVSSLTAKRFSDGSVSISRKFMSGVMAHQEEWPGPVVVIMPPSEHEGNNLDYARIQQSELPFKLEIMTFKDPRIKEVLGDASLVLLMLYHLQFGLAALCRKLKVPFIYTSEYTLKTRLQIIDAEVRSPLKRWAKVFLETYREHQARHAVKLATGIQSNGVPTYREYAAINPNTMLFFDTRIREDMLAEDAAMRRRFDALERDGTLRLAFSGRLIKMKGADHLIKVARVLKNAGKQFTISICGSGDLRESMEIESAANDLKDNVIFKGVLDFETELVPFIRENVDVFLCCHRQGDPSCTYLETMSCGVPIAGYANEAFAGLHAETSIGWVTPMDDPDALAGCLISLTPNEIREHSTKALEFARRHTFEAEFSRRMAHARSLSIAGQR